MGVGPLNGGASSPELLEVSICERSRGSRARSDRGRGARSSLPAVLALLPLAADRKPGVGRRPMSKPALMGVPGAEAMGAKRGIWLDTTARCLLPLLPPPPVSAEAIVSAMGFRGGGFRASRLPTYLLDDGYSSILWTILSCSWKCRCCSRFFMSSKASRYPLSSFGVWRGFDGRRSNLSGVCEGWKCRSGAVGAAAVGGDLRKCARRLLLPLPSLSGGLTRARRSWSFWASLLVLGLVELDLLLLLLLTLCIWVSGGWGFVLIKWCLAMMGIVKMISLE